MGMLTGFSVNDRDFVLTVEEIEVKFQLTKKIITINGTEYTESQIKDIYDGIAKVLPDVKKEYYWVQTVATNLRVT